jgi:hypothetical protein
MSAPENDPEFQEYVTTFDRKRRSSRATDVTADETLLVSPRKEEETTACENNMG